MTFKTTFPNTISVESTKLILNALKESKAEGYTLSVVTGKLRQMYHKDITKDKADSIRRFLDKHSIPYDMKVF